MSAFSTNAFRFSLPGDSWVERTIHLFRRKDDPQSAFAISRRPAQPSDLSVEELVKALPDGPYDEKEVVRSDERYFGAVAAQDVSVVARNGTRGEYYRMVVIPHHGSELSFQWAGPIAARDDVDARVERTLHSLRFWQR